MDCLNAHIGKIEGKAAAPPGSIRLQMLSGVGNFSANRLVASVLSPKNVSNFVK